MLRPGGRLAVLISAELIEINDELGRRLGPSGGLYVPVREVLLLSRTGATGCRQLACVSLSPMLHTGGRLELQAAQWRLSVLNAAAGRPPGGSRILLASLHPQCC